MSQNYSVTKSADLKSVCTQGYDLLSGDVNFGKNLIKGNLPYSIRGEWKVRKRTKKHLGDDHTLTSSMHRYDPPKMKIGIKPMLYSFFS